VADPLLLATDLADHLTRAGMPFREAHGLVGALVRDHGAGFIGLPPEQLEGYPPALADTPRLSVRASVRARDVEGGTAPRRVAIALRRARRLHAAAAARLAARRSALPTVEGLAHLTW
jgi:argininosuccinate lyase